MRHHLPLVAHAHVTSPSDRVRCTPFSTVLSATACVDRTLALKMKPGHTRSGKVVAGVARFGPCARCDLGATARARLAVTNIPAAVEVVTIRDPDGGAEEPRREAAVLRRTVGLMEDHVPSLYGPREFDCTGDPQHWPCGTGREVIVAVGDACPTVDCDGTAVSTTAATAPSLAPFCPRCRHRGRMALQRGRVAESDLAEWVRAGLHATGFRRKKVRTTSIGNPRESGEEPVEFGQDIFDDRPRVLEVGRPCTARQHGSRAKGRAA